MLVRPVVSKELKLTCIHTFVRTYDRTLLYRINDVMGNMDNHSNLLIQ